jgi:hypothetical protein
MKDELVICRGHNTCMEKENCVHGKLHKRINGICEGIYPSFEHNKNFFEEYPDCGH